MSRHNMVKHLVAEQEANGHGHARAASDSVTDLSDRIYVRFEGVEICSLKKPFDWINKKRSV